MESFADGEWIVYSKTVGDNLPLVTTAVQDMPCVDPSQNSDPGPSHPLERDRNGCSIDPQVSSENDFRYIDTGSQGVSEWDVQADSGVLATLKSLPMYTHYAGDDYETAKKNKLYKLWVRPTITWKLECEDTIPRSAAVKLFSGGGFDWSELT